MLAALVAFVVAWVWFPLTMALWCFIVAALLIVGSIPFFLGLTVVLPLLGHATWHLYRKAVEPDASPHPDYAPREQGRRQPARGVAVAVLRRPRRGQGLLRNVGRQDGDVAVPPKLKKGRIDRAEASARGRLRRRVPRRESSPGDAYHYGKGGGFYAESRPACRKDFFRPIMNGP